MNTVFFIAVGIFGLLVGLSFSIPDIKDVIRIRRIPAKRINALKLEGLAYIVGKVIDNTENRAIKSPLTQKACKLWQVEVQEKEYQRSSSSWRTIYKQISQEPFDISDGTGQIKISPSGANLALRIDTEEKSNFLKSLTPQIKSAVERLGVEDTWFPGWSQHQLQVYERIIASGDKIYILGAFNSENGIKNFKSETDTPLIISDYSDRDLLLQQRLFGIFVKILFAIMVAYLIALFLIPKTGQA
jgi:hypothetical protein